MKTVNIAIFLCASIYQAPAIEAFLLVRPPVLSVPLLPTSALSVNKKRTSQKDGVYSRPSAAIERGSGFFIPGLEGPKVRLLGGGILLGLVAAVSSTTSGSDANSAGNLYSQGLAAVFSLLVLFQGAVELQKESGMDIVERKGQNLGDSAASSVVWQKRWSMQAAEDGAGWRDKIEWAASSYLALTPASNVLLVGPGKVLFSLGSSYLDSESPEVEEGEACFAALETISNSKGGRVALPETHPMTKYLSASDKDTRCVVLQRISQESLLCFAVASDQLLASFTKQDLKWLGRLGEYVVPE